MFERYTESARRALFFSRYEASQLGAVSIETEHLLLGLVREGAVLTVLLPVPLDRIRREIEGRAVFREKVSTSVEFPFSAETKRVLGFAAEEADALRHAHIGSEHLLLGLLREEHSVAASTLAAQGIRLSDVRREVAKLRVPLEASSQSPAQLQVDQIKRLVAELAQAPQDSREARELVARICASLDNLTFNAGG
jgi:ATP-dependent Clp protease ATP-binding subunit ClpC